MILVLIPGVQSGVFRLISQLISDRIRRNPQVLFVGLAVASWVIFWMFRQKYGFLGDGYLRADDLTRGQGPGEELGIMHLLIWLNGVLAPWGRGEVFTMQVFSVFWGAPYVYFTCLWANRIKSHLSVRALAVGCLLFVGTIQYFFGYIEVYAPMPVFLLAFSWTGWRSLAREGSLWWPTLLLLCGVFMHVMMAACIPAWIYLCYVELQAKYPRLRCASRYLIALTIAAFLGARYALGLITSLHVPWLPLFSDAEQPYAVFSTMHLWEWINAQVLGAPAAWPLLILCGLAICKKRRRPNTYGIFLILSAGTQLYGSLTLNFMLGSRDWDLKCFAGISVTLVAVYGVARLVGSENYPGLRRYLLAWGVAFSALNTAPWVYINHTDRSVELLDRWLNDDPAPFYLTYPPELVQGMLYTEARLTNKALAEFEQGMSRHPEDARILYNAAVLCSKQGLVEQGIRRGLRAVSLAPTYARAHAWLAFAYDKTGRSDKATLHAMRYLSLVKDDPRFEELTRTIQEFLKTHKDKKSESIQ